jgi:hypothetical protein
MSTSATTLIPTGTWAVDPGHSKVEVKLALDISAVKQSA